MPEYDNNMRGVLFKAREKRHERSPDYNGNCEIDGKQYWVSGWIKDGRSGKFLSLSFSEKDAAPAQKTAKDDFLDGDSAQTPARSASNQRNRQESTRKNSFDGMDDDIPF